MDVIAHVVMEVGAYIVELTGWPQSAYGEKVAGEVGSYLDWPPPTKEELAKDKEEERRYFDYFKQSSTERTNACGW